MDLFKDKTYDELDEISQLVEPYNFGTNEELAQFPDEIEFDEEFILGLVRGHARSIRKLVHTEAQKLGLLQLSKHCSSDFNFAEKFFKLEVEEGTTFNAVTKELSGSAKLIKVKMAYEDKEIDEMLLEHLKQGFRCLPRPSQISKSNINEICDLFGATEALKDRSARGKINFLYGKYKELLSDRTLNIRDVELFKRFVDWNIKYIVNGSLPAMSNITKVKIMMRSELPIYSIKEEVV